MLFETDELFQIAWSVIAMNGFVGLVIFFTIIVESQSHLELVQLKNKILYVPEYTLIKFAAFTGDESKRHKLDKLFKGYNYPYKVLPTNKLVKLALNSEEPIYYLSYIKSNAEKYVSVINSHTGNFVYSEYTMISYNVKDKDVARFGSDIKKMIRKQEKARKK